MKSPASQPIPLMTAKEFERRVREFSRISHMVRITDHVFKDRAARGITRMMIVRALRKGTVAGAPKWDAAHGNWVGQMRYIATGTDLTVVCAIRDGVLTVTVVTAYGRRPGR